MTELNDKHTVKVGDQVNFFYKGVDAVKAVVADVIGQGKVALHAVLHDAPLEWQHFQVVQHASDKEADDEPHWDFLPPAEGLTTEAKQAFADAQELPRPDAVADAVAEPDAIDRAISEISKNPKISAETFAELIANKIAENLKAISTPATDRPGDREIVVSSDHVRDVAWFVVAQKLSEIGVTEL